MRENEKIKLGMENEISNLSQSVRAITLVCLFIDSFSLMSVCLEDSHARLCHGKIMPLCLCI